MPPAAAPVDVPPAFLTLDALDHLGLSGTVYYAFRQAILVHQAADPMLPASASEEFPNADAVPIHSTSVVRTRPGMIETNVIGSVIYNANASNDANQDVEPAISTIRYNGIDWIVTVATKYITDPVYGPRTVRSYYSRSTGAYPPSYSAAVQLSTPAGYKHVSDPYLAENPYASSGVSPHTLYCVGILHNDATNQANAVAIWRSTDGGATWQGPTTIAPPDNTHFFDKPSITVSYSGSTVGWVYVSWVDINLNDRGASHIKIARSCDGGATFPLATRVDVSAAGYVADPQAMVDNVNGNIYIVYTNHEQALRRLRMARVLDGTNCSLNIPSLYATEDVTGTRNLVAFTDPQGIVLNRNVQAATVPVARFNFAARRIGVVWHEREYAGASTTDAYITTRDMATGSWTTPRLLTVNSARDQFMPTLDCDGTGRWVTSFYNRAPEGTNTYYESYYRPFQADGVTPIHDEQYISATLYDPMSQPTDHGFIGDYQDIWEWDFTDGTTRWNAGWIATSQSDNFGSVIYDR